MFELADSGSSGGLPLPPSPLSRSLSLPLVLSSYDSSLSLSLSVPLSPSVTFPPVMRRRTMLRWHRCARPRQPATEPARSPRSPRV